MGLEDVVGFFLAGAFVAVTAFVGALCVAGLVTAGVFLGRLISKKLPELWEKLP